MGINASKQRGRSTVTMSESIYADVHGYIVFMDSEHSFHGRYASDSHLSKFSTCNEERFARETRERDQKIAHRVCSFFK